MQLRIKEIAKQKKVTQQELADKMGYKIDMVKYLYRPTSNPSAETLQSVAQALGVEVWELFPNAPQQDNSGVRCPWCGKPINIVKE